MPEAAYNGGDFKWLVENKAQEVAGLLGISFATLPSHLRMGDYELLGELFS